MTDDVERKCPCCGNENFDEIDQGEIERDGGLVFNNIKFITLSFRKLKTVHLLGCKHCGVVIYE